MNDRHEQSRAAFEAEAESELFSTMRDSHGQYLAALTSVMWQAWCRALDYAAEQQAKQKDEHVCAMHMDMMGTCFVCGSVNESIRQAREAEESARPKDTAPTPLTRPDRPGWWWRWIPGECMVSGKPGWIVTYLGQHDLPTFDTETVWLPVTPPPAPSQTTKQNK